MIHTKLPLSEKVQKYPIYFKCHRFSNVRRTMLCRFYSRLQCHPISVRKGRVDIVGVLLSLPSLFKFYFRLYFLFSPFSSRFDLFAVSFEGSDDVNRKNIEGIFPWRRWEKSRYSTSRTWRIGKVRSCFFMKIHSCILSHITQGLQVEILHVPR